MLDLNDPRWQTMQGGYRMPFDPRPLLRELETSPLDAALWGKLIEDLYHQGDVGEASYAAVPEIARLILEGNANSWHSLNLVFNIELARNSPQNPPIPDWIEPAYTHAIGDLANYCLNDLNLTTEPIKVGLMLGFLTLWKGMRVHARAFDYSESDLIHYFDES